MRTPIEHSVIFWPYVASGRPACSRSGRSSASDLRGCPVTALGLSARLTRNENTHRTFGNLLAVRSLREARVLTQRQFQLLKFITDYQGQHGVPPSFDEMRAALKLRPKSGIHRLIGGLEARGARAAPAHRAP